MQKQEQVTDVFFDKGTLIVHWKGQQAPRVETFQPLLDPIKLKLSAPRPAPESLF